jgi:hypothetical protein
MSAKFTRNRGSSSGEYRRIGSTPKPAPETIPADYHAGERNPQFRDHDIRSFDDREHVIPVEPIHRGCEERNQGPDIVVQDKTEIDPYHVSITLLMAWFQEKPCR